MPGELNAKLVNWYSWLTTRRGKHLRNYAEENSGPIFESGMKQANHTNPATPGVLHILMKWKLYSSVYLSSCSDYGQTTSL
jgi:hypothetical protein